MFALLCVLVLNFTSALGAEELPPVLQGVGIHSKLGDALPLDEEFIDEAGKTVSLRTFFQTERPVIFILNYYSCPMLCGQLLNGASKGLQSLDWRPGDHYKVVTISIDPKEDTDLAAAKKKMMMDSLKQESFRKDAEANWHFLVGKNGSEARIAAALGFGYKWVPEENQFAHGAAIFIASPDGKLSRVLQGIEFSALDLKLALLDAGQGKIGTFAEKVMGLCYHWDPKDSKNVLLASRLVSIGGAIAVGLILLGYLVLYLRNRRKGNACSLSP